MLKKINQLKFYWETTDPFIFCVHHNDLYPSGNDIMGPDPALLKGRSPGNDFTPKDGWRMYHGHRIPGFPVHPHRGFETVTLVRAGFIDHSDSLGAAGRYGNGDVQWMTAGAGIQHCEMFPMINTDSDNHVELFQIWLNLPARNKMVDPHFDMLWADTIPEKDHKDENGALTRLKVVAGNIDGAAAPPPAPNSWAADPSNEVGIFTILMEPGAKYVIPPASEKVVRTIYYFRGDRVTIGGEELAGGHSAQATSHEPLAIINGKEESEMLVLQAIPIGEPAVQYGPFVMNSEEEIRQAFVDYRATEFGGWPWPERDNVHPRNSGRFAKHADGRIEER